MSKDREWEESEESSKKGEETKKNNQEWEGKDNALKEETEEGRHHRRGP